MAIPTIILALTLLLLIALLTRRLWSEPVSLFLAPGVSWPEGLALSFREQLAYRYYIGGLDHLKQIKLLGKLEAQPLHTVYIHARLCAAGEEPGHSDKVINIYQALEHSSGMVLITGEPGAGKSMLTRYLINRILCPTDASLDPNLRPIGGRRATRWVPIFIDLRSDIARDHLVQIAASVPSAEVFERWLAAVMFHREWELGLWATFRAGDRVKGTSTLLHKMLMGGYAFIALDGLEYVLSTEATEGVGETFMQCLRLFAQQYCQSRSEIDNGTNLIVATARPGESSEFVGWDRFDLLPLVPTYPAKLAFLHDLVEDNVKAQAIAVAVTSNARVCEAAGNPFLLSLFAYLLGKRPDEEALAPFARAVLYHRCVGEMWKQWPDWRYRPLKLEDAQRILGLLAYGMMSGQHKRLACRGAELNRCIEAIARDKGIEVETHEVRRDLTDRTGYLYPIDPWTLRRKAWLWYRFWGIQIFDWTATDPELVQLAYLHPTFQEFFAYCHLHLTEFATAESAVKRAEMVCSRLDDPWWQEIVAMYLSQQPDAPRLILQCLHRREGGVYCEPDIGGVREFLLESFTAADLLRFCQDRPFLREATRRMSEMRVPTDVVATVLEYAAQHGCLEQLLEQAKQERPQRFARHEDRIYPLLVAESRSVPAVELQTLFLLARVLGEYQIDYGEALSADPWANHVYNQARSAVVGRIESHIEATPRETWEALPRGDSLAVGELLTEDDWQMISTWLEPAQPVERRRTTAVLCGKLGGGRAVSLLLRCLDDEDDSLSFTAVRSLQSIVDQAAEQLLETIRATKSDRQRSRAIQVIAASANPEAVRHLLSVAVEKPGPEVIAQIKSAVVEIAYDGQTETLHPVLSWYLREPRGVEYDIVFDALVEAREDVIGSLLGRLCDPTQQALHLPILDVLSRRGTRLAQQRGLTPQFRGMLAGLLHSEKFDEVDFALQILGCAECDWALPTMVELCRDMRLAGRWRLIDRVRDLQPKLDCANLTVFPQGALRYLGEHDRNWLVRLYAGRSLSKLDTKYGRSGPK